MSKFCHRGENSEAEMGKGKASCRNERFPSGNSDSQILTAMRAYLGMALVSLAAVKAKRL
jgi:hypothetical protein